MSDFFTVFILVGYLYPFLFPGRLVSVVRSSILRLNQLHCQWISPFSWLSSKTRPISCHFFQVVNDAEQVPLDIHLGFTAQCESVQPHDPADMGEWRFNNGYPQAVQGAAGGGVDLVLHLFGESLFPLGGAAMEIGHLPDFRPVRMTQALRPKLAGSAS